MCVLGEYELTGVTYLSHAGNRVHINKMLNIVEKLHEAGIFSEYISRPWSSTTPDIEKIYEYLRII
ncbi:hypothetical protein PR048_026637 [Dryococelus australis]|uniref:Uncharacterized protein n=1 Tax=Dryococelus australis TaxID=614101 RepID=A0ABQ9GLX1_9NEOP|nr:hypothetical protein PR048_026637 [Dryococelus australis]